MDDTVQSVNQGNAEFRSLSEAEKRVAIAKDVKELIAVKKFSIKDGRYWITTAGSNESGFQFDMGQEDINDPAFRCECCAAGAVLLSGIHLFNESRVPINNSSESDFFLVESWFSDEQMALIEAAFEVDEYRCMLRWAITDSAFRKARCFMNGLESGNVRVVAIMDNIIANNGTFVPPDKVYEKEENG